MGIETRTGSRASRLRTFLSSEGLTIQEMLEALEMIERPVYCNEQCCACRDEHRLAIFDTGLCSAHALAQLLRGSV
jgi:hypothetical protein